MALDTTRYYIDCVAPALPNPPQQYSQRDFTQFNNTLRLYFAQLDKAVRDASTSPQAQAAAWFFS